MSESALQHLPLFARLGDRKVSVLQDLCVTRKVPAATLILREDEKGNTIFIILTGRETASMHSIVGKEVILSVFSDGDFSVRSLSWTADRGPRPSRQWMIQSCHSYGEPIFKLLSSLAKLAAQDQQAGREPRPLESYDRVARDCFSWPKTREYIRMMAELPSPRV